MTVPPSSPPLVTGDAISITCASICSSPRLIGISSFSLSGFFRIVTLVSLVNKSATLFPSAISRPAPLMDSSTDTITLCEIIAAKSFCTSSPLASSCCFTYVNSTISTLSSPLIS